MGKKATFVGRRGKPSSPPGKKTVVVLGGGHLGGAMARGLVALEGVELWVCDRHRDKRRSLLACGVGHVVERAMELPMRAELAVLAVKPAVTLDLCRELRERSPRAVVSVAAGVTLGALRQAVGPGPRLFRVMANTASALGEGTSVVCAETGSGVAVDKGAAAFVEACLRPLGPVVWANDERLFDAITAVLACAPAYFLLACDGLSEGGVHLGLERELAERLAVAALRGAAAVAEHSDLTRARRAIVTPGGATAEGIGVLERAAVRAAFADAAAASARRANQLCPTSSVQAAPSTQKPRLGDHQ